MKKIFSFLILGALSLSACGGSNNTGTDGLTDSQKPFFSTYKTAEFSIDVPDDWEIINAFPAEYPDEIRVAFRNNIKEGDRIANVSVIRENGLSLTNADLAQEKLTQHEETLLNYDLLGQEEILIPVNGADTNTVIYSFTGKENSNGAQLLFMQTYATKASTAWTVTASYEEGEDEFVIEHLLSILKSFQLK